jgi:hypothetical protein
VERREQRVAQIVRDFLEAYCLSERVGARLLDGGLDYGLVEGLVGESEQSTLFRLKEECHALFRTDGKKSPGEVQAEELFDLAVGALFHEAMKFKEAYYVTTAYGPRLERIVGEGTESVALVAAFKRLFEGGRKRMIEAQAETADLFRETRDQLGSLLRRLPESGLVARSLLDDPERCERVFATPLDDLLADFYGSPAKGYQLAIESLIESGHYVAAADLFDHGNQNGVGCSARGALFAHGMAEYYEGNVPAALESLGRWIDGGASPHPLWHERAHSALRQVAESAVQTGPLAAQALDLLEQLKQVRRD